MAALEPNDRGSPVTGLPGQKQDASQLAVEPRPTWRAMEPGTAQGGQQRRADRRDEEGLSRLRAWASRWEIGAKVNKGEMKW